MNGHIDETRLNDYLDGLLAPPERAAVDEHLASCEACAGDLAAISEMVAAMGALPIAATPARDLWTDVQARMAGTEEEAKVVQFPGPRRRESHWVTMTLPQLAAAGIALAFISGGSVWFALSGGAAGGIGGPGLREPLSPLSVTQTAAVEYERAVTSLEEIVERGRNILDPRTLATLEASLESIENAIHEAQDALAEDPESDLLHRLILNHQQAKLRVLQQAAAAARL